MADIVLVHGAWHGPWCWGYVEGALKSRGHKVVSLALPGHEAAGHRDRIWNTIGQYVEALRGAVDACMNPPILVGHSMGGYVVQRYLESADVEAAVLVASVPANGALGANLRTLRHHPYRTVKAMLTANYIGLVDDPDLVQDLFFTPDTPGVVVDAVVERLQNESARAINTMVVRPPRTERVTTPVHVVAAEHDAIFTLDEQRALAAAYRTQAVVIEGGHDLMLDTSWPQLAAFLAGVADGSIVPAEPEPEPETAAAEDEEEAEDAAAESDEREDEVDDRAPIPSAGLDDGADGDEVMPAGDDEEE